MTTAAPPASPPASSPPPVSYPFETLEERDDFVFTMKRHLHALVEARAESRGGGPVRPADIRAEMAEAYRRAADELGWDRAAAA